MLSTNYFNEFEEAKEHFMEILRIDPYCYSSCYNYANLLSMNYFQQLEEAKNIIWKQQELNQMMLIVIIIVQFCWVLIFKNLKKQNIIIWKH